jgi:hypothetical protein
MKKKRTKHTETTTRIQSKEEKMARRVRQVGGREHIYIYIYGQEGHLKATNKRNFNRKNNNYLFYFIL